MEMEIFMKGISAKIKRMEADNTSIKKEEFILDNGLIINNKDKEKKLGQTKQFMKVNI
jgi:hypothetical protein